MTDPATTAITPDDAPPPAAASGDGDDLWHHDLGKKLTTLFGGINQYLPGELASRGIDEKIRIDLERMVVTDERRALVDVAASGLSYTLSYKFVAAANENFGFFIRPASDGYMMDHTGSDGVDEGYALDDMNPVWTEIWGNEIACNYINDHARLYNDPTDSPQYRGPMFTRKPS